MNFPFGLSSYTSFRCTRQDTDSHDGERATLKAVLPWTDVCKEVTVSYYKLPWPISVFSLQGTTVVCIYVTATHSILWFEESLEEGRKSSIQHVHG